MKIYERFADKGYHSSILTTFGVDFSAYENIVLPRLRGAGCRNNIVIPDARMLTHALTDISTLPRHAGKLYTVAGATARQVFHPKLFLQVGRKGGRIMVGSANLTSSGLAGNLELVGTVSCGAEESAELRLVATAWQYLKRFVGNDQEELRRQNDWMLARAPWLRRAVSATDEAGLVDKTEAALLTTGMRLGIGQRFAALVDEPVTRLIVVSPYWDKSLSALSYLNEQLAPREISVVIDPEVRQFPKNAATAFSNLRLYSRSGFREGRFLHAKLIVAQTESADLVLFGSANCTVAAIGREDSAGENEEVCLYRRFPSDTIIEALGLASVLTEDHAIPSEELDEPGVNDDLPLEELARLTPGLFEVRVDVLVWRPAPSIDAEQCTIELLDENGMLIPCTLSPLPGNRERRFQISGTELRPSFARLVFPDGDRSAPAIVTLIDRMISEIRETRSRKTENALRALDSETEAELMLIEVIDILERVDLDGGKGKDPISIPKPRQERSDEPEVRYKVLCYEQFVAGRCPRASQASLTHNSLAGSEVTLVRGFLNRILGMEGQRDEFEDLDDNDVMHGAFNLGDETADAEAAIAMGEEFGNDVKTQDEEELKKAARKRKSTQRNATRHQLVTTARKFGRRIKDRQENGLLDNRDILRLRALMMIIAAASWAGSESKKGKQPARASIQVLPAEGDSDSWPLVMGRLLFAVFGGNDPAIRQLNISNEHDQIPNDFVECWATCYWCFQACLKVDISEEEMSRITKYLSPIASYAYCMTLPTKKELLGEDVMAIINFMSARYAERIGVDPEAIRNGHQSFVEALFQTDQAIAT